MAYVELALKGMLYAFALLVNWRGSMIFFETSTPGCPYYWIPTSWTKQLSMAATSGGEMVVRMRNILAIPRGWCGVLPCSYSLSTHY